VIIPEENRKDLADIPKNVTQGLDIIPVKWIDQVLDVALVQPLTPQGQEQAQAAKAPETTTEEKPASDAEPARRH
jgi:ATP-dependent Lon protease